VNLELNAETFTLTVKTVEVLLENEAHISHIRSSTSVNTM